MFLCPRSGDTFKFPCADGTVKLAGGDPVLRKSNAIQEHLARDEEHNDVSQGESDGSQPLDQQADDVESQDDFWSIYVKHILIVITLNQELNLICFFERSFLKPLKYIDVVRWTSTTLDVLLGSHINDYWNVDGGWELSGP